MNIPILRCTAEVQCVFDPNVQHTCDNPARVTVDGNPLCDLHFREAVHDGLAPDQKIVNLGEECLS